MLKALDEHYGKPNYGDSSDSGDKAIDIHIWLSPANLKEMARNIYDGLKETDPSGKDYYEKNLEDLLEKISEIQSETEKLLEDFEGRSFLAYHPPGVIWGTNSSCNRWQYRRVVTSRDHKRYRRSRSSLGNTE